MNEEKIINISKLKIECNNCQSELTFNASQTARSDRDIPYNCPLCGNHYGMEQDDNPVVLAQRLLKSVKQTKGATMSFICGEEA